uniref:Uncharacterized protein n=1 Tax=Acrobeloides nanus TaxID=290746 RepID=A0A914BWT9_9BILA
MSLTTTQMISTLEQLEKKLLEVEHSLSILNENGRLNDSAGKPTKEFKSLCTIASEQETQWINLYMQHIESNKIIAMHHLKSRLKIRRDNGTPPTIILPNLAISRENGPSTLRKPSEPNLLDKGYQNFLKGVRNQAVVSTPFVHTSHSNINIGREISQGIDLLDDQKLHKTPITQFRSTSLPRKDSSPSAVLPILEQPDPASKKARRSLLNEVFATTSEPLESRQENKRFPVMEKSSSNLPTAHNLNVITAQPVVDTIKSPTEGFGKLKNYSIVTEDECFKIENRLWEIANEMKNLKEKHPLDKKAIDDLENEDIYLRNEWKLHFEQMKRQKNPNQLVFHF